jgi:hypothetical protein
MPVKPLVPCMSAAFKPDFDCFGVRTGVFLRQYNYARAKNKVLPHEIYPEIFNLYDGKISLFDACYFTNVDRMPHASLPRSFPAFSYFRRFFFVSFYFFASAVKLLYNP